MPDSRLKITTTVDITSAPIILTPDPGETSLPPSAVLMYFITSVCVFAVLGLIIAFVFHNKKKKEEHHHHHIYRHGAKETKSKTSPGSLSGGPSAEIREPSSKSNESRDGRRRKPRVRPKSTTSEENAAVADDQLVPDSIQSPDDPKFVVSLPPLEPKTSDLSIKIADRNAYLLKKWCLMHGAKTKARQDSKKLPQSARVCASLAANIVKPTGNVERSKETEP